MLRLYKKFWDWDLIFGRAVKAISSPGVRSPWVIDTKGKLIPKCRLRVSNSIKKRTKTIQLEVP